MPAGIRRRLLVQMFGGSPTVALSDGSKDLTPRTAASFLVDGEKATQSAPVSVPDLPPDTAATHVSVYQGGELQWQAELPVPIRFSSAPNRVDFPAGHMVFYI